MAGGQLFAIVTAALCTIVLLSAVLVLAGQLIVTR
ncbi:hypothetical protein GALL_432760 [mine drainage metagenome]|uniref:Uncharacterized protein n=1 Tax=mine drainage metagenome TaxID=410659 RepID=A0A1J5PVD5_9ZZZZ